MPQLGKMWRHVIISTRRSWLHGEPRGFRSRKHRIHSSGDYKNPPPAGERAGLLRYHRGQCRGPAVRIPKPLRAELGALLVCAVLAAGHRLLVLSVSRKHAHLLLELPRDRATVRAVVGTFKCLRTPRLRRAMPGSVWGEGGKYKPVRDRPHLRSAFRYIRDDQGPGAWTWTFRDPVPSDPRRRKRERTGKRPKTALDPAVRPPRSERTAAREEPRRPQ